MKNRIKYFLVSVYLLFCSLLFLNFVKADSGWDTSYDSGGSYDGGGSSSSDWGGSSGGSFSSDIMLNDGNFLMFVSISSICFLLFIIIIHWIKNKTIRIVMFFIVGIIWLTIYILFFKDFIVAFLFSMFPLYLISGLIGKNIDEIKEERKQNEIVEQVKLKMVDYTDISYEDLCTKFYDTFVRVQNAWMNFDYNELKRLCGNELYNTYYEELEALKLKGEQNVMKKFDMVNNYISNIEKINNDIVVTYILDVKFCDYVINTETNSIVRGKSSKKINNNYELKYILSKSKSKNCPNCGASINAGTTKCSHCDSVITQGADDFVLVHKKIVSRGVK